MIQRKTKKLPLVTSRSLQPKILPSITTKIFAWNVNTTNTDFRNCNKIFSSMSWKLPLIPSCSMLFKIIIYINLNNLVIWTLEQCIHISNISIVVFCHDHLTPSSNHVNNQRHTIDAHLLNPPCKIEAKYLKAPIRTKRFIMKYHPIFNFPIIHTKAKKKKSITQ